MRATAVPHRGCFPGIRQGRATIPESPGRLRNALGLFALTVLLPLAFLGLGLWEWQRSQQELALLEFRQVGAAKTVVTLEDQAAAAGNRFDTGVRYRRNGQTYVGPLALAQAREALAELESPWSLPRLRAPLPPVVVACAGLAAALSALALLATSWLGWRGRRRRDALVSGFSLVRGLLPALLGTQVVLVAVGFVSAVAFEASAILEMDHLSAGGAKLLALAGVLIALSLWGAVKAVMELRRTIGLFEPDPLVIQGRPLSREEAPGLWRMVDTLAGRLGALRPDHMVAGLDGGFFVASGPKLLQPGGATLDGRTLYVPLPYLALLREDEVAAIIGHELAHFAGGDTEYSLRFLPIYAGVSRSLEAVAQAGEDGHGRISYLMRPSLRLGAFAIEQFHLAVRHWSRLREFAADADGAKAVSTAAAAGALLRTSAAAPRIGEALGQAFRAPQSSPPDLVAAILQDAASRGLDDPARHLEEEQPHPTDTHPPTRQRLVALGHEPGQALLAEAAAPPPADALVRLGAYLADPLSICRAATADFLQVAREQAQAHHQALEAAIAGVRAEDVALSENTRGGAIFLFCFGGVLVAGAAALPFLDVPGADAQEIRWVAAASGALGLFFVACGIPLLRRGDKPYLVLRPREMAIAGLDRPIAWAHLLDVEMVMQHGRVVTKLLLPPEAPFPARVPRGRRVKLDAKRRTVTFAAAPPRDLKAQGYAELIARYREADAARRHLAEAEEADRTVRVRP